MILVLCCESSARSSFPAFLASLILAVASTTETAGVAGVAGDTAGIVVALLRFSRAREGSSNAISSGMAPGIADIARV